MNYQILDWDSDFFGIKTARIAEPLLTIEKLPDILSELKHKSVKLVYWPSSYECDDDEAKRLGGYLVDNKTTFVIDFKRPTDDFIPSNIVEPYSSLMPVSDLEDLAVKSGEYSRFNVDPRFPKEKFKLLYKTWINRSLSKEMASEVLVIREDGSIVGMVTLGEKERKGSIGLIAVNERCRGKKYGEKLVFAAQKWFTKNSYASGQVVTQGRNIAACNLYNKCGYSIDTVVYFYHFWL